MSIQGTNRPTSSPRAVTSPARWAPWQSASIGGCAALVAAAGWLAVPRSHLLGWGAVIGLLTLMTGIVGLATTGRAAGVLIDRWNRFSIARLQLWLWTVLITSGVFVAGMANVTAGIADPLQVDVPDTLWALMGLGVTSAIGAPLLQEAKVRRPADPAERDRTVQALEARGRFPDGGGAVSNHGQLVVNLSVADAASADLFTGDEVGDAAFVNLGKLQFAFVSLLGMLLYTAALAEVLGHSTPIRALPALDNGLVTLLGISHAGFLAHTAAPHSLTPT